MRTTQFDISGEPVPKGRPRMMVTASGKAHTYTPGRTKAYEDVIGWRWRERGESPFEGAVQVSIHVFEGAKQHAGDLDNYVKVVLDALNGLAFADDKQVVTIHALIERGVEEPHLEFTIINRPEPRP